MNKSTSRNNLRKVVITGHQEYWEGYFHAWCELNKHAKAIIEHVSGNISIEDATKISFKPWIADEIESRSAREAIGGTK